ncbi:hypothetical protein [Marinococcus halophilus]|uniref:hypothetical protein n=1 Tax=Marinococcus halophilus TaxID=1371 RepID=UPI0009A6934D|nr:hypothetical protein [Marinococcus halophilus]
MANKWFEHPWIERFLPDHMRPVDDHIFSDSHGLFIVEEMEAAIDRVIARAEELRQSKRLKRENELFLFRMKLTARRIRITSSEKERSQAAIQKTVTIDYVRSTDGHTPAFLREALVHYMKNGKMHARNIEKSSYFQHIFRKLEVLDYTLQGRAPRDIQLHTAEPVRAEEVPEETPVKWHAALDRFYQHYVVQDASIPPDIQQEIQQIAQELEELRSTSSLQFDVEEEYLVERMLSREIPDLIETYRLLEPNHRHEQHDALLQALEAMHRRIGSLRIEQNDVHARKMRQLLKINEKRYRQEKKF